MAKDSPVSQMCALIIFPSISLVRIANSTPIVGCESKLNLLRVIRERTCLSTISIPPSSVNHLRHTIPANEPNANEKKAHQTTSKMDMAHVRLPDARVPYEDNL